MRPAGSRPSAAAAAQPRAALLFAVAVEYDRRERGQKLLACRVRPAGSQLLPPRASCPLGSRRRACPPLRTPLPRSPPVLASMLRAGDRRRPPCRRCGRRTSASANAAVAVAVRKSGSRPRSQRKQRVAPPARPGRVHPGSHRRKPPYGRGGPPARQAIPQTIAVVAPGQRRPRNSTAVTPNPRPPEQRLVFRVSAAAATAETAGPQRPSTPPTSKPDEHRGVPPHD